MKPLPVLLSAAAVCAAVCAALAAVWCLLLRCRRLPERWAPLRGYRYAHRGLYGGPGVPENSLPAFRLAAERGFGAELDVHLTRDGRLAVLHDSLLRRTCGADGRAEDFTSGELRRRFRLEGTGEPIPFLEEVLPLFEGRGPLIVEIKTEGGNAAAVTAAAAACLDRFSVRYCMESFDPRAVLWLRLHRPDILRGQLAENFLATAPSAAGPLLRLLGTYLLSNFQTCPDFIAYRFSDRNNPSLRLCRRVWGVQTMYWTIRTPAELAEAEAEGAIPIFEHFQPEEGRI